MGFFFLSGARLTPQVPVKGKFKHFSIPRHFVTCLCIQTHGNSLGKALFLFQDDFAPVHKTRSIRTWCGRT